LREGLRNVCAIFGWFLDADAFLFYIPSWWRWNRPENGNVLRGNLKDLSEIRASALVDAFVRNIEYVPEGLQETFLDALRERLPRRSPIQDQDQDQKQKQDWARGCTGKRPLADDSVDGCGNVHLDVARECLALTNPHAPMEDLIDAFGSIAQHRGIAWARPEAIAALSTVLAEQHRTLR
jgi:hypothetical protein